jgi:hypothetical protein
MGEKVVLPKFELPGDRTHPALKILAVVGGMMLLCTGILGMAVWRHHSEQMAAEAKQAALIAQRTAEANAAAEAAKARAAEAAAKLAAAQAAKAGAATPAAPTAVATDTGAAKAAGASHHRHHASPSKTSGAKTVAAKGTGPEETTGKKVAQKPAKKDDAVDKILASFK